MHFSFRFFQNINMVNRSLVLGLISKKTTMFYGHKFVFTHVLSVLQLLSRSTFLLSFPVGFLVGLNKSQWDEISQSTFSGTKEVIRQMAGNMNI